MHHLTMFWSTGREHIPWWRPYKIMTKLNEFLSPRDSLAIGAEFLICVVTGVNLLYCQCYRSGAHTIIVIGCTVLIC